MTIGDVRAGAEGAYQKVNNAWRCLRDGIISHSDYMQVINQVRADEGLGPAPVGGETPALDGWPQTALGICLTDEQRESIRKEWERRHAGLRWSLPVEPTVTPTPLVVQDTIGRIDLLQPKDGDVLAIECREPLSMSQLDHLARTVNEHLKATGRGRVLALLVENLGDIRTLDEGAMRAHGWVRDVTAVERSDG